MKFTEQEKKVFSKMGKKGGKIGGAKTKEKKSLFIWENG